MKPFVSSLFKALVVLALVAVVGWWATQSLQSTATVAEVRRGVAIDAVPASITVEPEFDLVITSDVGGRIKESRIDLGSVVEEGDVLVKIDETDLRLSYEQFKVDYNALKQRIDKKEAERAELRRMEEDLENSERNFREGEISKLQIERRREDFRIYKEQLELKDINERQDLENMEIELKKIVRLLGQTDVIAPASGVITEIYSWPGELINKGTGIAALFSDKLLIKAKVNEENFAGIQIGQSAQIRFLAYGGRNYPGKVSRVLPNVDSETQQYTVYLELEGNQELLKIGLTGEALIIKDRREDSLVIPRRALMGGDFVFVVNNGVVQQRQVDDGFRALNFVEIRSGLEEGDLVISDELDRFRDGDKVRIERESDES